MKKAINLERADGRRIQFNADDIQFIEEGSNEDKTNIMVRHFGQITVSHNFDQVLVWLDILYGRQQLHEKPEPEGDEAEESEAEMLRMIAEDEAKDAQPLHSDRSRKSVLGMMRNRHVDPSADS